MNNTPTLMQSEEERAPWNDNPFEGEEQKTRIITVNISQCLSTTVDIEVPEDFDESDERALEDIVREQIILPSEVIFKHSQDCWYVDDFCVTL
jgi:hypothetical protein